MLEEYAQAATTFAHLSGKAQETASHAPALTFESSVLSEFTKQPEADRRDGQFPAMVVFVYTSVQYDMQTKTGAEKNTITSVTKKQRPVRRP